MPAAALAYTQTQRAAFLADLSAFLRIPSISTLPEHAGDLRQAADWLADHMRRIGLDSVELMPTPGHPVVYGEWLRAGPDAPTLLCYGHYDVQPTDPLAEWRTPPFAPTVLGDDLFARGASDDKGQVMALLAAVEAYLRTDGLPINLKIIVEGEEEISSPHMAAFVEQHRTRLAADAVLICDSALLNPDQPLISYGVRGLTYMEVEVQGPTADLHSGVFGGAIDNPFNVLVHVLAQLQDPVTHRVLIPGFYDRVRAIDENERAEMQHAAPSDAEILRLTGALAVAGEAGYSTIERITVRPTLDIHGMPGGFTGPGKKNIIPARAAAKVSMRLVPDQDPADIARLFQDYVTALCPPTVSLDIRILGLARPAVIDIHSPAVRAAATASERVFGVRPAYLREGGSIPIIPELQGLLGAPVVMLGLGLPDDGIHGPNEKIHLPTLYRGVESLVHYFELLADAPPSA